jgi:hypothetical protein
MITRVCSVEVANRGLPRRRPGDLIYRILFEFVVNWVEVTGQASLHNVVADVNVCLVHCTRRCANPQRVRGEIDPPRRGPVFDGRGANWDPVNQMWGLFSRSLAGCQEARSGRVYLDAEAKTNKQGAEENSDSEHSKPNPLDPIRTGDPLGLSNIG